MLKVKFYPVEITLLWKEEFASVCVLLVICYVSIMNEFNLNKQRRGKLCTYV